MKKKLHKVVNVEYRWGAKPENPINRPPVSKESWPKITWLKPGNKQTGKGCMRRKLWLNIE